MSKATRLLVAGTALSGISGRVFAQASLSYHEQISQFEDVSSYNNYYEFSSNKKSVKHLAQAFEVSPWQLEITGEVEQPLTIPIEDLLTMETVSRIYPLRCVEGWSAVIPWQGILLKNILALAKPKSSARYVAFESVLRPEQMLNQRRNILPWPYQEGLRLDEAMHPLTMVATGMYDRELTKQNGAPLRLVVPWKYGFKSIKALHKIKITREMPVTSWSKKLPKEYGFYANVNPQVAHPRWSQSRELRLGEFKKRRTLKFNGFEKDVSHLYSNMDLSVHF